MMIRRSVLAAQAAIYLLVWSFFLHYSAPPLTDQIERIRAHTRNIEFDYVTWTLGAAWNKAEAASVGLPNTLPAPIQARVLSEHLAITQRVLELEQRLEAAYSGAAASRSGPEPDALRAALAAAQARQTDLAPLAESVLEGQLTQTLAELELTLAAQPVPAVLYHTTPLPIALIVSRRDRIEQIANISLEADLGLEGAAALEGEVDQQLEVSSLVVPIGGVGVYPTMVIRSSDLRWLAETVAHEWTHNFLTLRPLGALYDATPELRTINETAASIVGTEVADQYLLRFQPDSDGDAPGAEVLIGWPPDRPRARFAPPPFDFRAEMHETRVNADRLLAEGRLDEAEAYMESRRLLFVQHGFTLRKLNQAYFAFYGAYADIPGGEAGEDPVGAAVRALRADSSTLAEFLNRISWITSFEQLQAMVLAA